MNAENDLKLFQRPLTPSIQVSLYKARVIVEKPNNSKQLNF